MSKILGSRFIPGMKHASDGLVKKLTNEVLNAIVSRSGDLPPILPGQAYRTWIEERSDGLVIRCEIVQLYDPSSTPAWRGDGSTEPPK